ncbi:chymotrypsin-1-like [Pieris rapae]|uniref:chymotrypsin-1-like n=1 Tax=Pieris rapae TaxID=64459 RepID=UPI001E27A75B|nr:chymotrypsin-1-like [Pieris rapae]XP_045487451.1 chymotrypsin-1-like [Pieris rapae]XP_045487452.1 chymotrypsin-1-like [Pieris rapae]XP_045487458.1 chymotrypsin-1-like [Pieris rapae]XP_045487461.1 chymotrypsin-1-like [Pieris rapae]XP_045487466.1 chymotrypsin-1-like [Pieris rapae]
MATYQISIRVRSGNQEWHSCGGSILNEEYVLTAAHCIYETDMKDMSIVVGTHTIDKGGDRYKIKKLIPHEEYSDPLDIGIIQIEGKIKYSDKIQPIELLKEMAPVGKKCLLTGWGYTDYDRSTVPNNLQMLEFETISNDDCTKQLKRSPYPDLVPVDAGQLCVKRPNNKGACHGDSGGPLVIQDDKNKTLQIGVVSWGVSCAKEYPDVFASVHGYYDWIQNKMK